MICSFLKSESIFCSFLKSDRAIHSSRSFVKSHKSESLPSLFKKSDGVKSNSSDSHLGIKIGKAVKTDRNLAKTTNFFKRIARFFREKEHFVCNSFVKSDESDLLMVALF